MKDVLALTWVIFCILVSIQFIRMIFMNKKMSEKVSKFVDEAYKERPLGWALERNDEIRRAIDQSFKFDVTMRTQRRVVEAQSVEQWLNLFA